MLTTGFRWAGESKAKAIKAPANTPNPHPKATKIHLPGWLDIILVCVTEKTTPLPKITSNNVPKNSPNIDIGIKFCTLSP